MNIQKMMKQMQKAQLAQADLQDKLEAMDLLGSAGGGMVKATASGSGQIKAIKLEKIVVDPEDVEALEDLILIAIQDAQKKAAEIQQSEMSKLMSGLQVPGMR